jgi:hypothetical protein
MTTAALQYLTDMNIDTSNRIRAVQDAGALEFDANTYRKVMGELTGLEINVADDTARTAFMYTVQFAVEGQPIDIAYQAAVPKAEDYVAKHPWINAKPDYEYEPTSRVDALGAPKQKKGAKKEAAIAYWNAHQEDHTTRKEWIEALMENVGLTSGAASTYHHNLKKGAWG